MEKTSVVFRDNDHLMQIIDRIISKVGRRVDETCPMVDARMIDGSRFNAIIPPLALDGACVSIRRFGANPLKLEDLLNYKAFTPEMVMLLEGAIKARLNILISGGTGSGKTTLLNTLSSFIPNTDRIVTIEDAAELQLQQDHVVRLETRPAEHRRQGRHHRHRPGAQRPAHAARTHHHRRVPRGGSPGHAPGHEHRPRRLDDHAARQHPPRRPGPAGNHDHDGRLRAAAEGHAHADRQRHRPGRAGQPAPGRARKITHITEVVGMEQDTVVMQDIYRYDKEGVDENGRAYGKFVATGVRPTFMSRLEAAGVRLPSSAFRERVMLED